MADWGKLPDLVAVTLLASAFASVARRNDMPASNMWLVGWILIAVHFAAFIFLPLPGFPGCLAAFVGLSALAWAGGLFMWATVPHRNEPSSRWIVITLFGAASAYIGALIFFPSVVWAQVVLTVAFGGLPLLIALASELHARHPLRRIVIGLFVVLSIFLLVLGHRPGINPDLPLYALFFTIYLGCCLHFLYAYKRLATGVFVTTAGFFAWASVFVVAPTMTAWFPQVHIESEVWNLPKYIVAVGMILLVLEQQIEHNQYLALHDELTGLPNRRLFQDRLVSALERARRTGTQTALLLLDLDRFKQVNDTAGHHMGDMVLTHVARILDGRVRRSDTVARTGGDEFSIILEEPITRDDAELVSRSLIELLMQPVAIEGHGIQIGGSVGIALYPEDAADAKALQICADLRMYRQKHDFGREHPEGPAVLLPPRPIQRIET